MCRCVVRINVHSNALFFSFVFPLAASLPYKASQGGAVSTVVLCPLSLLPLLAFTFCCSLSPVPETSLYKVTFIFKLSNSMTVYVLVLFDLVVAFDTAAHSLLKTHHSMSDTTPAYLSTPLSDRFSVSRMQDLPVLPQWCCLHRSEDHSLFCVLPTTRVITGWPCLSLCFPSMTTYDQCPWLLFSAQTSLLGSGPTKSTLYLTFLPEHYLLTSYSTWIKIPYSLCILLVEGIIIYPMT